MFSSYILELMDLNIISVSSEVYQQFSSGFMVMDQIFLWVSTIFAVISGVIYVMDNKHVIQDW